MANKDNIPSNWRGSILVDTHCHLGLEQFDVDREAVIARAEQAGVMRMITIGIDPASSRAAVALAETNPAVYATIGQHPHGASRFNAAALAELKELARHPKVVAIGEMGLDFYRNLSPHDAQRAAFEAQLALARDVKKPVVVHIREAYDAAWAILKPWADSHPWRTEGRPVGVLHCYSGDLTLAEEAIVHGFFLGFDGPITYENVRKPLSLAQLPLDHILVETDSPYLTPRPYKRSARNEPAYVRLVAQRIAELKQLSFNEVAAVTTANAERLFTGMTHVQ